MVLPSVLPRRPFVRLLAVTDGSPLGLIGLEYLKAMLRVAPVRLFSVTGGLSDGWERFGALMSIPLGGAFVNAVCCPPARWSWMQTVQMPNRDGSMTTASERKELYTVGARNVLITDYQPQLGNEHGPVTTPDPAHSVKKYEAIVVPTAEIGSAWEAFGCHADVVPIPVVDGSRIRELIMPT